MSDEREASKTASHLPSRVPAPGLSAIIIPHNN